MAGRYVTEGPRCEVCLTEMPKVVPVLLAAPIYDATSWVVSIRGGMRCPRCDAWFHSNARRIVLIEKETATGLSEDEIEELASLRERLRELDQTFPLPSIPWIS